MLKTIVDTKENMIRTGETRGNDLLGLLLQFNNENNSVDNNQMTKEDIKEECKQFYLAGHETTSSLLTWTLIVLAIHQDWQEKARQEVLQVVREKNPDAEGISHLKIVSVFQNKFSLSRRLIFETMSNMHELVRIFLFAGNYDS